MTQPFLNFQNSILVQPSAHRLAITNAYRRAEPLAVKTLLDELVSFDHAPIEQLAKRLVREVRSQRTRASGVDALMHEFSLSSEEGVALMCLAEALLRIPDTPTVDRLIADKISKGDWKKHLGESPSLFVNAATWGLLVTGKMVATTSERGLTSALSKLISKGGEPLIRKGVDLAMRMLGNQFVTGQTIGAALKNSQANEQRGYRYSYDMLGEAALTAADAAHYYASYEAAIHAIGKASNGRGIKDGPGISVKLSALHPRYSRSQRARVMTELLPDLKKLLLLAKHYNIGFNIDAEEADRLELSLDLVEVLVFDEDLNGFEGLGIVVQAYQKRCPDVVDYLIDLARRSKQKLMIRLVKGAYWDSEIKRAQVDGLVDYPVYTRKVYTDVSYLVCAQKLLAATDVIYPQFATHNALTLSAIFTWAEQKNITDYEFQCLHGMGETLYDQVVGPAHLNRPCRIYAPVGSHETLLAYLVRRLLENGANSSFVNQIVDEAIPLEALVINPVAVASELRGIPHNGIRLPAQLFSAERRNSSGFDFSNEQNLRELSQQISPFATQQWHAKPLIQEVSSSAGRVLIHNPADLTDQVGDVIEANSQDIALALEAAASHAGEWQNVAIKDRAAHLNRAADLLESHRVELIALAIREAGKSFPNAVAEVREAVDFLRYYAAQCLLETTTVALGPVVCISPWNFPLAIFLGEVSAALAVGNVVVAKPAEQTPLIAFRAVQLLHQAGIPVTALQLLPGRGEVVGAALVADTRIKAVVFTGSTEVAQLINRTLNQRCLAEHTELPLIAETGGQNTLIVDSSALPEQVVQDVISSAFDSAGQRCSALRVLCLQDNIYDKTMKMLNGAMQELRIGSPDQLDTDIGPVIDKQAQDSLHGHIAAQRIKGRSVTQVSLPVDCANGYFVAPTVIEITSLSELTHEVFGPVLHVIRFRREDLGRLVEEINQCGYGLTLGVHSRIDETINYVIAHAHVGNIYINRNIVGAVVGVQPFGGGGKSGTGPKAGGPLYLKRLQRDPRSHINGHALFGSKDLPLFELLLSWLISHGHDRMANVAKDYALASPLNVSLLLPGPTGEQNTLAFAPRGDIFCAAQGFNTLLNQLAAVLATGNHPVISASSAALLPPSFPEKLGKLIKVSEAKTMMGQVALIESCLLAAITPVLAARTHCIVSVLEVSENSVVPLWRLLAERAVCVNTTAAGGNASLMTLED